MASAAGTPIDEYDQQVEEKEQAARELVKRSSERAFGAMLAVVVLLMVFPAFTGSYYGEAAFFIVGGGIGILWFLRALTTAVRTFHNWPRLCLRTRFFGLLPWMILCGVCLFVLLADAV